MNFCMKITLMTNVGLGCCAFSSFLFTYRIPHSFLSRSLDIIPTNDMLIVQTIAHVWMFQFWVRISMYYFDMRWLLFLIRFRYQFHFMIFYYAIGIRMWVFFLLLIKTFIHTSHIHIFQHIRYILLLLLWLLLKCEFYAVTV